MAGLDERPEVLPTVLDRLIDPASVGAEGTPGYALDRMTAAVRRDLEDLLNTRQTADVIDDGFREVKASIINYGFPDLSAMSASAPAERQEMCRLIRQAVIDFEPRLHDVQVRLNDHDPDRPELGTLHFLVEGKLDLGRGGKVVFATTFDLTTGHTSIDATE